MENKLTHFDQDGKAIMVDVSEKENTQRTAVAKGSIYLNKEAFFAVKQGNIEKGDVLGVARVAGIMAAKRTFEFIPMCHPLLLTKCSVEFYLKEESYEIQAFCTVKVNGKTGVEMEALTGVNIALLTIYDMCKAINKNMEIGNIHLIEKQGGKSGHYKKEQNQPIIFAVSGLKKAGKTSLIEKLIPLLKEQGYKVGTIKHDGHVFTLDEAGTDTDRHKKAGAKSVTIYSDEQTVYRGEKHTFQELIKMHKEIDVLIVEGLKNSGLPKVEIIKDAQSSKSICTKETLLAIVTDKPDVAEGVPSFRKEEVNQLAELLKKYIEQEKQKSRIQND